MRVIGKGKLVKEIRQQVWGTRIMKRITTLKRFSRNNLMKGDRRGVREGNGSLGR